MQVICITHERFHNMRDINMPRPEIGEIVTVVDEKNIKGIQAYRLKEYYGSFYNRNWYDKRNFSPLSDIDETELVNNKHEEYA